MIGTQNAPVCYLSGEKPDGTKVQISKCPEGHGKVKSPLCCGADMACPV